MFLMMVDEKEQNETAQYVVFDKNRKAPVFQQGRLVTFQQKSPIILHFYDSIVSHKIAEVLNSFSLQVVI